MTENTQTAESIIEQFDIPSRPEALTKFAKEAASPNCSLENLSEILRQDVNLMAALLQLVNSPLIGIPQKITSADQAIALLGVPRCLSLVRAVSIRASLGEQPELPRFWDSATETAHLCERIAILLTGLNSEYAYTSGLFSNCGIPLMIQAFEGYADTLREANHSLQPLTWLENDRYNVTHCRIGYELALSWKLPKTVCETILLDPVYEDAIEGKIKTDELTPGLLAILQLAKQVSAQFRKAWRVYDAKSDQEISRNVLSTLGLTDASYSDLQDQLLNELTTKLKE